MKKRPLPPRAGSAVQAEGARLIAPAATRNCDALCELLQRIAPAAGKALEIASGTGQHVAAFARRLPSLSWQPTEIDPERRASINAYSAELPNVAKAVELNAVSPGWHDRFGGQDLIVLINLLHLISWPEVDILVHEAARALNPAGRLVLYGPFMRAGRLTSDGDIRFHHALTQQDPEIGYKDDAEMLTLLRDSGLKDIETAQMPANNLAFIARRPAT